LTDKKEEIAVPEAARKSISTFGCSHPTVLDIFGCLQFHESMSWPRMVMSWKEVKAWRISGSGRYRSAGGAV